MTETGVRSYFWQIYIGEFVKFPKFASGITKAVLKSTPKADMQLYTACTFRSLIITLSQSAFLVSGTR